MCHKEYLSFQIEGSLASAFLSFLRDDLLSFSTAVEGFPGFKYRRLNAPVQIWRDRDIMKTIRMLWRTVLIAKGLLNAYFHVTKILISNKFHVFSQTSAFEFNNVAHVFMWLFHTQSPAVANATYIHLYMIQ